MAPRPLTHDDELLYEAHVNSHITLEELRAEVWFRTWADLDYWSEEFERRATAIEKLSVGMAAIGAWAYPNDFGTLRVDLQRRHRTWCIAANSAASSAAGPLDV